MLLTVPIHSDYNVITMELDIIKIGNSKGVRLSKSLLEQLGIKNRVVAEVQDNKLVLKAKKKSRQGWVEQFASAVNNQQKNETRDLPDFITNEWDAEWEWK